MLSPPSRNHLPARCDRQDAARSRRNGRAEPVWHLGTYRLKETPTSNLQPGARPPPWGARSPIHCAAFSEGRVLGAAPVPAGTWTRFPRKSRGGRGGRGGRVRCACISADSGRVSLASSAAHGVLSRRGFCNHQDLFFSIRWFEFPEPNEVRETPCICRFHVLSFVRSLLSVEVVCTQRCAPGPGHGKLVPCGDAFTPCTGWTGTGPSRGGDPDAPRKGPARQPSATEHSVGLLTPLRKNDGVRCTQSLLL